MTTKADQLVFEDFELTPTKLRTTVRFTQEEYLKIKRDSEVFGRSLPVLLRVSYFGRLPTRVLMAPDQYKQFMRVYSGIANNLNQLTKQAHLGHKVPQKALEEFSYEINQLFRKVNRLCGNSQN